MSVDWEILAEGFLGFDSAIAPESGAIAGFRSLGVHGRIDSGYLHTTGKIIYAMAHF